MSLQLSLKKSRRVFLIRCESTTQSMFDFCSTFVCSISLLLAKLLFNIPLCFARSSLRELFLYSFILSFNLMCLSFCLSSPSERFHSSPYCGSLRQYQRSNTPDEQRGSCGLQGKGRYFASKKANTHTYSHTFWSQGFCKHSLYDSYERAGRCVCRNPTRTHVILQLCLSLCWRTYTRCQCAIGSYRQEQKMLGLWLFETEYVPNKQG